MALTEAVLTYRPSGSEGASVVIGRTADPSVLRALRERLLEEAQSERKFWREVDDGLAGLQLLEGEHLAQVLDFLVPSDEVSTD